MDLEKGVYHRLGNAVKVRVFWVLMGLLQFGTEDGRFLCISYDRL